jgi:protein SCO1/2
LLARVLGLTAAAALLAGTAAGQAADPGRPDEARLVYRSVPDVRILTAEGEQSLRALSAGRPLLVGLVFTRCAGVCSPFVGSLKAAVGAVGGAGRDYRVLLLSFDPRDTADDMEALAARHGLRAADGWVLGWAAPGEVRALADAIGFWWRWDEGRGQFDHPALVAAVRDGRLQRLLVGADVGPVRLQEALRDAAGRSAGAYPLPGRVLFRCFDYDPATGRLRLDWGLLVLGFPALAAAVGTLRLFSAGRRHRAAP